VVVVVQPEGVRRAGDRLREQTMLVSDGDRPGADSATADIDVLVPAHVNEEVVLSFQPAPYAVAT
jgi:hypothetical protein